MNTILSGIVDSATEQLGQTHRSLDYLDTDEEAHRQNAGNILKQLEKAGSYGSSGRELFDLWLRLVLAELEQSPDGIAEALTDIARRTRPPATEALIKASGMLRQSPRWGYYDILGPIFCEFANPNKRAGQFFTPWRVALLMAQLTIMDGHGEVRRRLEEAVQRACEADPEAAAKITALELGWVLGVEPDPLVMMEKILRVIAPWFQPLTIADPCVGAGVTLIAAAAQFPAWMVQAGMIRFYALDIDISCILMIQVVMKIFRMNGGRTLRCNALTATDAELARFDPVSRNFYGQARAAFKQGGMAAVQPFIEEANRARQEMAGGPQMAAGQIPLSFALPEQELVMT